MACNENIIKNIASEVTRNCQGYGVTVEEDFVTYLIELLLVNPKYGKLFSKHIKRDNLEYFVNECVAMLTKADTAIHTLKMQFVMQTNYDKLQNLVDKHLESIENCLRPLVMEIVDEDPGPDEDADYNKLFRKISIYIILASGLGNPSSITTLKEGVAALESVFSMDDLKVFVTLTAIEKMKQLGELVQLVSGVRLFNRDCKKGGDGIPDLPFNLVDASNACLSSLSNSLIAVMQKVNTLTTAVEDSIYIQDETGNVCINETTGFTAEEYTQVYQLLAFYRQYEVYTRRLLTDVELMLNSSSLCVERVRRALEELHSTVKYKAAVPVLTVFPLFAKLWQVWRDMQNIMYLVSTVNRTITTLESIHELITVPDVVDKMLIGRKILTDQERMTNVKIDEKLSLGSLKNYVTTSSFNVKDKDVQFLGFCAISLAVGALIPGNVRIGYIKLQGYRYGFCNVRMAKRFSKTPERYINEVLNYARNNPHIINLLNIMEDVEKVKDISVLVIKYFPKTKVSDKDIQTEAHPVESYIEKNYTSDLWKWKRRACQWATIVNCRTHSTQTIYSHLRSDIQSQTVHPRDKEVQTKRDCAVNTTAKGAFVWGIRGQLGDGQHMMPLEEMFHAEKQKGG
ncbi:cilia- and flagella-associated protein 206 [Battus philenor]|uniref:cilia- and flagella-associated protein 206 n=1 Tax=Battus philenor TaxID=42288 RepID=UPI0035D0AB18